MVDDPTDREDGETGEGEVGEEDDTDFVADDDGNIEVLEPEGDFGDGGQGGQVGQEFPGVGFGAGPFRGRDRFTLTPASFWSRPLRLLMIVIGVIFFANVLPNLVAGGLTLWRLIGLVGLPLIAGVALLYRAWKLPDEKLEIRFTDEHIDMPKGADNPSRVEVDYRDIRSLFVMVRGQSEVLLLETEKHRFALSDADFQGPNGPRLLKEEIMRRIRNHPDHRSIVDRMRRLEEYARAASNNPTPVTYVLIGAIIVGYVIQHMTGAWSTQFGLLQLGANSAPLVADGQWWRLISANFLHGNFLHIFLNGIALLFLGISIERLIGSWRFLLIYLVTAVGGAVGSYMLTEATMSLGASTALYGLVGAFLMIHVRYWSDVPPPYRQTVRWWVIILVLNFGLSALPAIDAWAHLAGMGVGLVLTFLILLPMPTLDPTKEASIAIKVAAAIMTAVFAAGIAQASNYAQHDHPGDAGVMVRGMAERGRAAKHPSKLNQAAWMAATWREATAALLRSAREAAEDAVEMAEQQGAPAQELVQYRDTLATVRYRLAMKAEGDEQREGLAEAIEIERDVVVTAREALSERDWMRIPQLSDLTEGQIEQFQAQLIRFLSAYESAFSRYTVGSALGDESGVKLQSGSGAIALNVELGGRTPAQTEIIAAALGQTRTLGAFQICLPVDAKGGVVKRFDSNRWSSGVSAESTARILLTDTRSPDCASGENSVEFWPMVGPVRGLP